MDPLSSKIPAKNCCGYKRVLFCCGCGWEGGIWGRKQPVKSRDDGKDLRKLSASALFAKEFSINYKD